MMVILNDAPVDFAAAVAIMDDEIRENVHAAMAPCSQQAFIDAYCLAHAAEFNANFILT